MTTATEKPAHVSTGGHASAGRRRGRPLTRRLRVRGWLRLDTPLQVGGLGHDATVDLAMAVDGRSRLYVPGTSLAGALRAVSEEVVGEDAARLAWGSAPNDRRTSAKRPDEGCASRVVVGDGLLTVGPGEPLRALPVALVEGRTGNGIDRHRGTVAEGFLYGRVVVPRGAYLRFCLDLESDAARWEEEPADAMICTVLRAMLDGDVRLGAARTRGLGRVVLETEHLEIVEQDLGTVEGLLAAVGASGTPPVRRTIDALPSLPRPSALTRIEIDWVPAVPVMVRAAIDGFDTKALPLFGAVIGAGANGDAMTLVVPGSSIKGAMRSHAERIVRTVLRRDAETPTDEMTAVRRSAGFRDQLEELDVIRALFGSAGATADDLGPALASSGDVSSPEITGPLDHVKSPQDAASSGDLASERTARSERAAKAGPAWGRGALGVDDCYAIRTVPAQVWRTLVGRPRPQAPPAAASPTPSTAGGGQPGAASSAPRPAPVIPVANTAEPDLIDPEQAERRALFDELATGYGLARADHVAIDRWTAAAAAGRLFSVLEPYRVEWRPIVVTVDNARLAQFEAELADAATALVLLLLRDLAAGRVHLGHGVNRGHGDLRTRSVTLRGFPDAPRETTLDDLLGQPTAKHLGERWGAYVRRNRRTADTTDTGEGAAP